MASLLLLADIASKDYCGKCEIGVQTEDDEQHHNEFSTTADVSIFETGPSGHDYIKQNDFDILVNANHDYYNRVTQNDKDLEHSYAFSVVQNSTDADCSAPVNNYNADDVFFEGIANLDEHMGLPQRNNDGESAVFEEIVQEDFDSSTMSLRCGGVELEANLFSDVVKIIEQNKLHFDDILRYVDEEVDDDDDEENNSDDGAVDSKENGKNKLLRDVDVGGGEGTEDSWTSENAPEANKLACLWADCSSTFSTVANLATHLHDNHLKTLPYVCRWKDCSRTKSFSERYLLERHLRTHTNEKPFQCNTCEKYFASKCRLDCHLRKHKGDRPYVCKSCGKKFSSSGDYYRHVKIHDSQSNYVCSACNKCYKDSSGLRKHRKACLKLKQADDSSKLEEATETTRPAKIKKRKKTSQLKHLPKWLRNVVQNSSKIVVIKI